PEPPGSADKLPFNLPFGKGYGIDGSWVGPNQVEGTTKFERRGEFSVDKSDGSDVDPKELAGILEKWVEATQKSISGLTTEGSSGELRRSADYVTEKTVGSLVI